MKVHLFIPCFIDQLYPQIGFNTIKLLEKAGCEVIYNPNQTCCGQPAFNAGFWGEAKEVCSKFINDFKEAEAIVAPSASCVGFVRNYYRKLFTDSSHHNTVKSLHDKTYELTDFLVNVLQFTHFGAMLDAKATYHDSCAALRECNIKTAPRKLLENVAGLQLVEMKDNETCCGFGGTFAVKFEPISIAMADQKICNAQDVDAEVIISTDMSCLMHIGGYAEHKNQNIQMMHITDVLTNGW